MTENYVINCNGKNDKQSIETYPSQVQGTEDFGCCAGGSGWRVGAGAGSAFFVLVVFGELVDFFVVVAGFGLVGAGAGGASFVGFGLDSGGLFSGGGFRPADPESVSLSSGVSEPFFAVSLVDVGRISVVKRECTRVERII